LRFSKIDQKLDATVEKKASVRGDLRVLDAARALDEGRVREGVDLLSKIAAAEPSNVDARLELLRGSLLLNDATLRAATLVDLSLAYLDTGEVEAASQMATELFQVGFQKHAPPERLLRLGERMAQKGNAATAGQCFMAIYRPQIQDQVGLRAALSHVSLLLRGGFIADAQTVLALAQSSGVSTPDAASRMEALRSQIAARSSGLNA
jgi:hypothetical protein